MHNNPQSLLKAVDDMNKLISDMEEAELQAQEEGLLPGQYNLSARTKQVTKQRIEEENRQAALSSEVDYSKSMEENVQARAEWIAANMQGAYDPADVMDRARNQIKQQWSPEDKQRWEDIQSDLADKNARMDKYKKVPSVKQEEQYLIDTMNPQNMFNVGGDDWRMLQYTDAAANQVVFDKDGNVSKDSPVRVIGRNEKGVPILAARKDYKAKGLEPYKVNYNITSSNPYAQTRDINYETPTVPVFGSNDPNKYLNIIQNHVKNNYSSINQLDDEEGIDMVRNLQERGLLRTSQQMQNYKEKVPPSTAPVSKEEREIKKAAPEEDSQDENVVKGKFMRY